jgi:hypothetical protein
LFIYYVYDMAPIMWPTVWDSTWYYYYCYYCCFVCSGLYLNELVDNAFFIKYILNVARIMMVISVRRLNLKVSISGYWLVAAVAHLHSWPGENCYLIWFFSEESIMPWSNDSERLLNLAEGCLLGVFSCYYFRW